MQLTAVAIARGLMVICVDTERGFRINRVHQLLGYHTSDVDVAMKRLLISSPNTMEHFMHLLTELEQSSSQLKKTAALIVDSVALFFRGCPGREDFQNWKRVLTILGNIAVHHNVAGCCNLLAFEVIYVNHVSSRPDPFIGRVGNCTVSLSESAHEVQLFDFGSNEATMDRRTPRSISLCGSLRFLDDVPLNLS
ncbi:hypothetical protein KIN20_021801 [Parelaphostrongylus tenuis]|uniref:Rad51-like C-terminal domain-containing protein n=1 Tax=Parelaphostrongylus tenuis TaxID=148309 RepID=A0AAD5QUR7_PARTN|nr:hypothetical protein KIN20_021801 [Parelaphostrongylus tenuis]